MSSKTFIFKEISAISAMLEFGERGQGWGYFFYEISSCGRVRKVVCCVTI